MAEFISEKLEKTSINNGVEFRNGDSPSASDFNNLVKGVLYNNENGGSGGTSITVDSAFSTTSTNPLQNKVITEKINELENSIPKEVVVDAELSTESTNPVQNKVVTEELNKKLTNPAYTGGGSRLIGFNAQGKITTSPKTSRAVAYWVVEYEQDGVVLTKSVDDATFTHSQDLIAINAKYFRENIGHRYKFTSINALDMFFGGGELVFYHDTKTQFDLDTIVQEILGKAIPFIVSFEPSANEGCVGNGSFYTASVVKNADNTLTIGFTKGNIHYWVSANTAGNGVIMDGGNTTFTVEQIY